MVQQSDAYVGWELRTHGPFWSTQLHQTAFAAVIIVGIIVGVALTYLIWRDVRLLSNGELRADGDRILLRLRRLRLTSFAMSAAIAMFVPLEGINLWKRYNRAFGYGGDWWQSGLYAYIAWVACSSVFAIVFHGLQRMFLARIERLEVGSVRADGAFEI